MTPKVGHRSVRFDEGIQSIVLVSVAEVEVIVRLVPLMRV
jgi:hypothetical protein